jgi:hypothetical protein
MAAATAGTDNRIKISGTPSVPLQEKLKWKPCGKIADLCGKGPSSFLNAQRSPISSNSPRLIGIKAPARLPAYLSFVINRQTNDR